MTAAGMAFSSSSYNTDSDQVRISRYEKMNSKILQWENKKKMKAKRRHERKEVC